MFRSNHHQTTTTATSSQESFPYMQNNNNDRSQSKSMTSPTKVLYIITSSNEYNTGDKETTKGQDRLMEILVPVVLDGVESMLTTNGETFEVDVYLILGYTLSDERQKFIAKTLPDGVGLQVWNDATPLNYDYMSKKARRPWLSTMSKSLARQHRFVVKDKLQYYDFFLAFEDDMLITKHHIDYYRNFMHNVELLKQEIIIRQRQEIETAKEEVKKDDYEYRHSDGGLDITNWFDSKSLTIEQLNHMKPGFLRVEVQTSADYSTQEDLGPIPVNKRARPDPRLCCWTDHVGLQGKLTPQYPTSDQLMVWETGLPALFVRPLPISIPRRQKQDDHWFAVLPIKGTPNLIDGYWSGTHGALAPDYVKKPKSALNEYIGQSAGWMMSQSEVLDMHMNLCKRRGFLPPFDLPYLEEDGMGFMTDSVEYWSGGLQLWGQTCQIQRIVDIDPTAFSYHLIYHTANNKQKEIPKQRLVKVNTLLGQLHTVKLAAQNEIITITNDGWSVFAKLLRVVGL